MAHPARFWHPLPDGRTFCYLCPQYCRIERGHVGFCRNRSNQDDQLVSLNYGQVSSWGLDPIEKKPLYHFYPGSTIFSIGSVGCSLACGFCQNWQIAQEQAETVSVRPERVVQMASSRDAQAQDCIGIAYTYNEPTIWAEFILDTAPLAREAGLKNVLVSNGYVTPKPWAELLKTVDAVNIDVKGYTDRFYSQICHGTLQPVRQSVEMAVEQGVHVEITTLLIPGENDDDDEIEALTRWLGSLDPNMVLHFSRYFPNHHMTAPATPVATLHRALEIASQYLHYVYLGNVSGDQTTRCPECNTVLIQRGWQPSVNLNSGHCPQCGRLIEGLAMHGKGDPRII